MDEDLYFSRPEAAAFLGISVQRVHQLIRQGELRPVRIAGREAFPVAQLVGFKALPRPTGIHKSKRLSPQS